MSLTLKGKFYCIVVKMTLMYGAECWQIKKVQAQKKMVTEMIIIRWIYGHTESDRIRSEVIRDKVEVPPIKDKKREARLR